MSHYQRLLYKSSSHPAPSHLSCAETSMPAFSCSGSLIEFWMGLNWFTFTFHFHALEKEMATHSSVLAWRIPGTGEPWWAAVYRVAQSRTRLKWLSSRTDFLGLGWAAGCVLLGSVHSSWCDQMKLKSPGQVMNRNRRTTRATLQGGVVAWGADKAAEDVFAGSLFFFFFNWRNIVLQCCVGFCPTTTQISRNYTSITYFLNLPSLSPQTHPSRSSRSTRLGSLHRQSFEDILWDKFWAIWL